MDTYAIKQVTKRERNGNIKLKSMLTNDKYFSHCVTPLDLTKIMSCIKPELSNSGTNKS